ncbi:uncharacterized protein AMSG_07706 [Thecamonas trahens ATCC 50062]|uniref:WW domain-containing protein n=1 Tax=Thecamonas trahens ATCC 50062 TaxID=461836 RepID=A0A0L0DH26_THETB|nr:hypothetical protein AMSG_07706 [Thecamonas trahens ATCC 50062]KNC51644.1 hypothetical protein AMSG_07706 [Thecamonas trahens ATCC 50062]|eukprot:XP_013755784.1 hypothetical protein AMSG_07706 [Thecamonas trahens ATCC 50062]
MGRVMFDSHLLPPHAPLSTPKHAAANRGAASSTRSQPQTTLMSSPPPPPPPQSRPPPPVFSGQGKVVIIVVGAVVGLALVVMAVGLVLCLRVRSGRRGYDELAGRIDEASREAPTRHNPLDWPPSTTPYTKFDADFRPLPKFWRMGTDPASGKPFYFQRQTRVRSKRRPKSVYK